jgi:hypothetical protein
MTLNQSFCNKTAAAELSIHQLSKIIQILVCHKFNNSIIFSSMFFIEEKFFAGQDKIFSDIYYFFKIYKNIFLIQKYFNLIYTNILN